MLWTNCAGHLVAGTPWIALHPIPVPTPFDAFAPRAPVAPSDRLFFFKEVSTSGVHT